MTRVATMGTSSCATIAVAGWGEGQHELNEAYKLDPKSFKASSEKSVSKFYKNTLYPTSQPLGHSEDMPFEKLMQDIDNSPMNGKFIIATINQYQFQGKDNYWPKELKRWGFDLIDKIDNEIGSTNYIYARNIKNKVEIKPEERL